MAKKVGGVVMDTAGDALSGEKDVVGDVVADKAGDVVDAVDKATDNPTV